MKTNLFTNHRRLTLIIGAILAITLLLIPDLALAQSGPDDMTKLLQSVQNIFTVVMQFLSSWLWPLMLIIGSLFDNNLIFGGAMGERLLEIWVQIRNLVNVIFVLILLVIAVYNVLGLPEEGLGGVNLSFKQTLPKFVIALIAVNFSFLGAKVVLDFTNVLTVAAFSLPGTLAEEQFEAQKGKLETSICDPINEDTPMRAMMCERVGDRWKYNARAKVFFERVSSDNIALMMAVNFGKLSQQRYVKEGLKDITQLAFNILFGVTIYAVYALSFIALFIVLLVRLVVLWVAVAFSPVIAITIVLPSLLQSLSLGEGGSPVDIFIQHAVAPLIIGVFLSIGYLMLDAMAGDPGAIGEGLAGVSLSSVDVNAQATDISDLQQLLIAVATVAVVWMGVFGAVKKTFAQGIVGTIEEHAKTFGKFIAKLPVYAQVIPVTGDQKDNMSLLGAFRTITGAESELDANYGQSWWQKMRQQRGGGDINALSRVRTKQELAPAMMQNMGVLGTPEGVNVVKGKLKALYSLTDSQLEHIGDDYKKLATTLYGHSELRPQLAEKYKNEKEFIEAVDAAKSKTPLPTPKAEKKPEVSAGFKSDKKDALSDMGVDPEKAAEYAAKHTAFNGIVTDRLKNIAKGYGELGAKTKEELLRQAFDPETGRFKDKFAEEVISAGKAIKDNNVGAFDTVKKLTPGVLQALVDDTPDAIAQATTPGTLINKLVREGGVRAPAAVVAPDASLAGSRSAPIIPPGGDGD
ncbi:MAG: hypothetical protein AAB592_05665 [Patescibacteria group bacterium]